MRFTAMSTLVMLALAGTIIAGAGQWLLTRLGEAAIVPPATWSATLAILGAAILALAWPVRRSVRSATTVALDPVYATRVLLLAKAGSLVGSALAGGAAGLGLFFLSRPVLADDALWWVGAALVGALVLGVGGSVAERWCAYPPDVGELSEPQREGEPS